MILKLRIWPARSGSGAADGEGALPFQRDCSIEESEDRSALPEDLVSAGAVADFATRQVARMPSPSSTEATGSRLVDYAAGNDIARFVLGDVFVDAGGNQLLHAELDLALFRRRCQAPAL